MSLKRREGEDLMNLMCGTLLGSGQYRHVYRGRFDENVVIKYEGQNDNRSNVFEFDMWLAFKDTELGQWLAPCYALSPNGTWLVQAYTKDIHVDQLPTKIPAIFCDLKPENWGWHEGRPVCRDYGNNMLYRLASVPGNKMVKADWSKNSETRINRAWGELT